MYLSFMISVYEAFCAAEFHSVVQPSAKRAGRAVFSLGKSQHDSEIPMFSGKKNYNAGKLHKPTIWGWFIPSFFGDGADGLLLGFPS